MNKISTKKYPKSNSVHYPKFTNKCSLYAWKYVRVKPELSYYIGIYKRSYSHSSKLTGVTSHIKRDSCGLTAVIGDGREVTVVTQNDRVRSIAYNLYIIQLPSNIEHGIKRNKGCNTPDIMIFGSLVSLGLFRFG